MAQCGACPEVISGHLGVPAGVLVTEGIIDPVVDHAAEHRYISHRVPGHPGTEAALRG